MDTLKAGQYGIADDAGSYYLMQVEKITPAALEPLKSVEGTIKSTLAQENDNQAFQSFGESLVKKAHVTVNVKS
jgi:hypothetical protein